MGVIFITMTVCVVLVSMVMIVFFMRMAVVFCMGDFTWCHGIVCEYAVRAGKIRREVNRKLTMMISFRVKRDQLIKTRIHHHHVQFVTVHVFKV